MEKGRNLFSACRPAEEADGTHAGGSSQGQRQSPPPSHFNVQTILRHTQADRFTLKCIEEHAF